MRCAKIFLPLLRDYYYSVIQGSLFPNCFCVAEESIILSSLFLTRLDSHFNWYPKRIKAFMCAYQHGQGFSETGNQDQILLYCCKGNIIMGDQGDDQRRRLVRNLSEFQGYLFHELPIYTYSGSKLQKASSGILTSLLSSSPMIRQCLYRAYFPRGSFSYCLCFWSNQRIGDMQ